MAGEAGLVMDQLVEMIEAVEAVNAYNGTTAFIHDTSTDDAEDLSTKRGRTRRFVIALSGGRELGGPIFTQTEPFEVEQEFNIGLIYPVGKDIFTAQKRIAEDMDSLTHGVMTYTNWNTTQTRIVRVTAADYDINAIGVEGQIGSYVVTLPITVRYQPSF